MSELIDRLIETINDERAWISVNENKLLRESVKHIQTLEQENTKLRARVKKLEAAIGAFPELPGSCDDKILYYLIVDAIDALKDCEASDDKQD